MSRFQQVETAYGIMTGFEGDLITRFLDRYGEWAPFESEIARSVVRAGDVIVDAGAFLGSFSISLLGKQPARICAVEANPSSFEVLHHNAMSLGGERILPLLGALGITPGQSGAPALPVMDEANRGGATFHAATEASEGAGTADVPALSLAGIRELAGDYALAKLDLEGCELMALKADAEYLGRALPFLIIEANEQPQSAQIANFCRELGYETHFASLPVWRRHNPKASNEAIFPLCHEGALLACRSGGLPNMTRELASNGGRVVQVEDTTQLIDALWRLPRWSQEDWTQMSKAELIAIIGRLSQGDTRGDFQVRMYPTAPTGPDLLA